MISIYRLVLSPIFGGACRFEPSCSVYAEEAFKKHPSYQALLLTIHRILKCRPGGPYGFDPVPDQLKTKSDCRCAHGS